MKKNIFRTVLFLGIILGMGYSTSRYFWSEGEELFVGGKNFRVERAETAEKRALGLGERDSLCPECALLFVFPQKAKHSFWMKGMRFPLDILWFNSADGKIIHLEKNIPADSQAIYTPIEPSDRVLEINAGLVDELGIQVGDLVK